jgi:hypothetical protein
VAELNILELEFLSINDFALSVSLEELQHYGDQLLTHWRKEHQSDLSMGQPLVIKDLEMMDTTAPVADKAEEEEELAPPVRRRARHLSIDKHGDEIDVTTGDERVYKKQASSPSP